MSEIPLSSPEKNKQKDDARKFVIDGPLSRELLDQHHAGGYNMTVDWTVIGAGSETKIACKEYDDGSFGIWRVAKVKEGASRSVEREELSLEKYAEAVSRPVKHLEKRRYEFELEQNGIRFSLKYDNIEHDILFLLEVDAATPDLRARFDADAFAATYGYGITEVSGKSEYEGHAIVDFLKTLK